MANRTMGTGCAVCSNKRVQRGVNDLWTVDPDLASQLVNPEDGYRVTRRSEVRLLWKCKDFPDHQWECLVGNRTVGRGCPFCAKTGFHADRQAWFYIITGDNVYGEGPGVKYGVTNSPASRSYRNSTFGFGRVPVFIVEGLGADMLALERRIRAGLKKSGIPTLRDRGITQDGSTEAVLCEDLTVRAMVARAKRATKALGLTTTSEFGRQAA